MDIADRGSAGRPRSLRGAEIPGLVVTPESRPTESQCHWQLASGLAVRGAAAYDASIMESRGKQLVAGGRAGDEVARLREQLDLVNAVPCGIVQFDLQGRVRAANPSALRVLGIPLEQLLTMTKVDMAHGTFLEDGSPCQVHQCLVSNVLATGEPQPPTTFGFIGPSGEMSWATFIAAPIYQGGEGPMTGAVLAFTDITDRKTAELVLASSESALRSVVTSVPSIILTADLEGRIEYINRSPVPGMTASDFLGTSIYQLADARDQQLIRQRVAGVLASREPDGFELTVARDGHPVTYSVKVGPVLQASAPIGVSLIATDVTELKELQSQLIISDRLASIGTLAAGVAHEINNPLTFVHIKLRALEKALNSGKAPTESMLADIAAVRAGADRIRNIVRDLGVFARSPSDAVDPIDVGEVLELAIQMASNEIRFRARLERDVEPLQPVMGDGSRLGQVFLNLLINAAHAIPEGEADHNTIRVIARPEGASHVRVEIFDTGRGIPAELLPRVFEPFVTTKDPGKGTGLGLHICNSIITEMGGELKVVSEPGKGTTFTVLLPAAHAGVQPGPAPRTPEALPTPVARSLDVLVIDDEPYIRRLIAQELDHHRVATAGTGREALALLEDRTFDVIFCDLNMPDLTGMDVHEQLARRRPEQANRMVFMTGGAFTPRARAFVDQRPDRVIDKPFELEDLHRWVARIAADRRAERC